MIHLTMIARVYDGLPLTASLQDENLTEYQNKGFILYIYLENVKQFLAKAIFRKLNNQSAPQMSIEHANMTFHYQIDQVRTDYHMFSEKIIYFPGCMLSLPRR